MKVTRFDPDGDLILVNGRIRGPRSPRWRPLRLVLDTGAAETIVIPEVIDELGYSPRDGDQITIDVDSRRIDVALSDEEIADRLVLYAPPLRAGEHIEVAIQKYAKLVGSAAQGAITL